MCRPPKSLQKNHSLTGLTLCLSWILDVWLAQGKRGQAYVKKETSTDDNGLIVLNVSLQQSFLSVIASVFPATSAKLKNQEQRRPAVPPISETSDSSHSYSM